MLNLKTVFRVVRWSKTSTQLLLLVKWDTRTIMIIELCFYWSILVNLNSRKLECFSLNCAADEPCDSVMEKPTCLNVTDVNIDTWLLSLSVNKLQSDHSWAAGKIKCPQIMFLLETILHDGTVAPAYSEWNDALQATRFQHVSVTLTTLTVIVVCPWGIRLWNINYSIILWCIEDDYTSSRFVVQ